MNEKKISFIICSNDEFFFSECVRYIQRLIKPEDIEIELIEIREASSMTAGYNEGMQSSDAKYKVYMHQDVFIRNKYFIMDIMNIFKEDNKIGLIGLVGSLVLPADAVMWYGERVAFGSEEVPVENYRYSVMEDGYWEVEAVDGLLMVTQYDVPWREDLFDGWDYYDISQCFEMKRRKYSVVVPLQKEPWYIHDDKEITNLWNHDKYRRRFLEEYTEDMQVTITKG
ncbi:glycosyltransferase family protein [Kineothrix sp. MB12-C1]|uniref:glycosyltransferase family protein n=1 Tax=Kineothrix sp. MB12-C1 TaxID=3070215 RepID=UPI0027D327F4|nr:glycosyltransferase family protein [Kineothrix sp. MB12-C1]WMC93878.1 glycosyltransferase family protein [Kineothrix sp. MB12-C1]